MSTFRADKARDLLAEVDRLRAELDREAESALGCRTTAAGLLTENDGLRREVKR